MSLMNSNEPMWMTAKEWADYIGETDDLDGPTAEEKVKLQMVRRHVCVFCPSGKKGGKLYVNVIAERAKAKANAIEQLANQGVDATELV